MKLDLSFTILVLNFILDPSGTMIEYVAKGIGAAEEGLQSLLLE